MWDQKGVNLTIDKKQVADSSLFTDSFRNEGENSKENNSLLKERMQTCTLEIEGGRKASKKM